MTITGDQLDTYRRTARRRLEVEARESEHRRQQAWRCAQRAATLLKQQYGATRVLAFGSVAHAAWFHERSDIDLAVAGLEPGVIWRAWRAVEQVVPGFDVDLVELETASDRLLQRIQEQGKDL